MGQIAFPSPRQRGPREVSVVRHRLAPAMHALFDLPQSEPAQTTTAPAQPSRRRDPQALLDGLNGPQRDAVTHEGRPLLIVAGRPSAQNTGAAAPPPPFAAPPHPPP